MGQHSGGKEVIRETQKIFCLFQGSLAEPLKADGEKMVQLILLDKTGKLKEEV